MNKLALEQTVSNIDAIIEANPYLKKRMQEAVESAELEEEAEYEAEQHMRWFKW